MAHCSHNNDLIRYLITLVEELVHRYFFLSLKLNELSFLGPK